MGNALADQVLEVARSIETKKPEHPGIKGKVDHFKFASRVDFSNPLIIAGYGSAFFPELVANFVEESKNGITPELNTVLLNGDIALVGGSGEFFSNHSNRLKERSLRAAHAVLRLLQRPQHVLPHDRSRERRGLRRRSPGVARRNRRRRALMNQALVNIYTMLGKFPEPKARG